MVNDSRGKEAALLLPWTPSAFLCVDNALTAVLSSQNSFRVATGVFLCLDCSAQHRNMGVHLTFVRSVDLDEWTQRQIDAMRLGGNENARSFLRKNGLTDLHGKIEKKYTSKAARLYKEELNKLVDQEAVKRGEMAPAAASANGTTNLMENLQISEHAEEDALARAKIAEARAAHAQPAQAKATLASQLPGASKLVMSATSATPTLRKPAASNPKMFLKKKSSSGVGASKLRINKLTTPSSSTISNGSGGPAVTAKDFDDFDAQESKDKEEAAAAALAAQEAKEAAAAAKRAEEAKAAAEALAAQPKAPPKSSMEQGVEKLKAMNSDFFANM